MSSPIRQNGLHHLNSPDVYAPRKLRERPQEPQARDLPSPQAVSELGLPKGFLTEQPREFPEDVLALAHKTRRADAVRKRWLPLAGFAVLAIVLALFGAGAINFNKETSTSKAETSLVARLQSANTALDQVANKAMVPMLAIKGASGKVNEPLPLGIDITNNVPNASLYLSGFLAGTSISAGAASGARAWRIPVVELPRTFVTPPHNYVGPMTIVAELQNASGQPIMRSIVDLVWTQAPADSDKGTVAPVNALAVANKVEAPTQPSRNTPDPEASVAPRQITPNEAAALFRRAEQLVSDGDLPAARLLLQRLAETRNARAAFELGATYDPALIKNKFGTTADPLLAKTWYQRARDWGSADASKKLEALANQK